ncbi:MAG: flagellar protein FlgN [Candidatus Thiodiazotropha lotti]|nr:flagellar protein FlgN [Candidatus Thiodiazotropha lotti]MCG8000269.1 flagellar protein FlgN [Candidatus Thiodiazotropha lotti]MCW4184071.1 flagellar protein FlgN [Candidatus Thiodiazotropha weberae]MCW4192039.1 flagellar protein FlgN [Candidatus Thiodiazotropha weberae]
MINPQQQMSFVRIVQTETELTQQLLNLLRQEFELLKSPPSKKLEELLAQKQQQLHQIEQSAIQHNQLLASLGFTPDRKGTEAFIQQSPDNAQLQEQWNKFTSLLEACQKQNEINGGAVQLNQHQVAHALDVLRGFANSDKTYGPGGESRPTSSSKSLGKA